MNTLFATLGWGLLSLLGLAVLTALWEYVRTTERRPWTGTPAAAQPPTLDVDLSQLAGTDQRERGVVLDATLSRMGAAPAGTTSARAWTDTRPMVAPSATGEGRQGGPEGRDRRERHERLEERDEASSDTLT